MNRTPRWRSQARRRVQIIFAVRTHRNFMRARLRGQTPAVRSVEPDCVELPLERALFSGCEINFAGGLVHARHAIHLPCPFRQLFELLAFDGIEVEVMETITLAAPEKLFAATKKS